MRNDTEELGRLLQRLWSNTTVTLLRGPTNTSENGGDGTVLLFDADARMPASREPQVHSRCLGHLGYLDVS